MPEPAVNRCPAYYGKTADEAAKVLAKLPTPSQLAWIKVQPRLLKDPVDQPLSRPMSRDGRLFLYSQPDPPLEVTYQINNDDGTIEFLHFSAPQLQRKSNRMVVVYSEKDKEWYDDLRKWIGVLEDDGLVELWDVSMIEKGKVIRDEIESALATARVILLLITQEFLHGDLKSEQLRLVELFEASDDGEFSIQWIAVKTSLWKKTPIAKYSPINDPERPLAKFNGAQRDEAYLAIHGEISKIVQEW